MHYQKLSNVTCSSNFTSFLVFLFQEWKKRRRKRHTDKFASKPMIFPMPPYFITLLVKTKHFHLRDDKNVKYLDDPIEIHFKNSF